MQLPYELVEEIEASHKLATRYMTPGAIVLLYSLGPIGLPVGGG